MASSPLAQLLKTVNVAVFGYQIFFYLSLSRVQSPSWMYNIVDMNEVEKLVRSIQADGLLWGACEYIYTKGVWRSIYL